MDGAIDYRAVFDMLPSPHMLLDRALCYVAVNAAYEEVTMRRREELLGRNLFEMFPNEGEGGRRLRASLERVFATGEPDTLAYISYDIPRPEELGGGMEKRYWTAVHTPVPGADGKPLYVMQNTVDVTEMVSLRQAATLPFRMGETRLLERAREAEEQHRNALSESAEFRRFFQLAPSLFAVLSGPDHVFTFANDAYMRLIGGRDVIGKPVDKALPEVRGQGYIELLDQVYRTGKPYRAEANRVFIRRSRDEPPKEMFLDFSYDAIRDQDGDVIGIFVQAMDRTEAVETHQRQQLLLAELNHRVKNTLASVQSIVAQTLRSTRDPLQAQKNIEERLQALSIAHNLLSAKEWTSADLRDVVGQVLDIFAANRVSIGGTPLLMAPKASIGMSMVAHELATNAAKYGSLSTETGAVDVSWSAPGEGMITIVWRETDGPPAKKPDRRGFGVRLIRSIVEGELAGAYEPSYDAGGFSCTMTLPLEKLVGARQ